MKEASDLNDGDIMGRTTFEQSPQGHRKFKFVLPTGQEITSEWIREDAIPQAGRAWPDAVRAQIVAHAQEAVEETKRKMRLLGIDTPDKRRAKGISPPKEGDIDSTGMALPESVTKGAVLIGESSPYAAPAPVTQGAGRNDSDPLAFAKAELVKWASVLSEAEQQKADAEKTIAGAEGHIKKWTMIVTTLQGVQ